MVTYYHRFLPGIARILAPLHEVLKGGNNKRKKLKWTPDLQHSFNAAKDAVAKATILAFPARDAQLRLSTDASDVAIGAALEQMTP